MTWVVRSNAALGALLVALLAPGLGAEETAPQALPSEAEGPVPADPDPGILRRRVAEALATLGREPSLHELQRAALRFADADPERASNWAGAPNRAALLPVFKFVAEHDIERDESLDRYQDEPDRWGADTDRDYGFQLSAQWNLGELLFSPDEVRVHHALSERATRREALLTLLVGYYFERRRLQVRLHLAPPAAAAELADALLRIDELAAAIDALTGGLLSRNLQGH